MNYDFLKHISFDGLLIKISILGLFIIFLIFSFYYEAYDTLTYYGTYYDNHLYLNILLNDSDLINKCEYLEIGNKKVLFNIESVSELMVNNNENYQEYKISINKTFLENEVVKITFYCNKEKMIRKIFHIIF